MEAASAVNLCLIPKPVLESLFHENASLEHRVTVQALRGLDKARDWMVTLGRKSAGEKVASFLHLIATDIDPTEKAVATFDLP